MTGGLRLCRFCCALLLSAAAITPALAVNIDLNGCVSSDSKPSQRIDLCTQVIESGEYAGSKLAWAYVNRGSAYGESGQLDKAIVDFNEALAAESKLRYCLGRSRDRPILSRGNPSAPCRI